MSRTLPTNLIEPLCSPSWVAKAYSEYMYDCAAAQATLIEAITEAASDEGFETTVDGVYDYWNNFSANVLNICKSYNSNSNSNFELQNIADDNVLLIVNNIELDTMSTEHNQLESLIEDLANHNDDFDEDMLGGDSWRTLISKYANGVYVRGHNSVVQSLNALLTQCFQNTGIGENVPITLNEGCVPFGALLSNMILDVNGLSSGGFPLKPLDFNNQGLPTFNTKAEEIFEQLKSSMASATAWAAGFAAMAQSSLADKIAFFNSQISTVIADTTERFANTVNAVRSHISTVNNNIQGFFDIAAEELGFNKIVEETFQTVDETDVYTYTGASPLSAINTNGIKGMVSATVKTVMAVGQGIFAAAKKVLSKVWRKISPFVKAITNDPVDIGVIDKNDDSYACSNFKANSTEALIELLNDLNSANVIDQAIRSKIGNWVSLDTYFGELCMRLTYYDHETTTGIMHLDYQYRPKCLNYRRACELGLVIKGYYNGNTWVYPAPITLSNLSLWNDFLATDYRPEDDEDEKYVYMGFWLSNALMMLLAGQSYTDLISWVEDENDINMPTIKINTDDGWIQPQYGISDVSYFIGSADSFVPSSVSNLDFIKMTSGFYDDNGTPYFNRFPSSYFNGSTGRDNNEIYMYADAIVALYMNLWIGQQVDKLNHPTEYLFLPYCNGTYDFSVGRYKIKTDAQNANIANVIAQALIVVAVVVIAVLVTKAVMKIIKTKRISNLSRKVGMMDNGMWNGQKLNTIDSLRYSRWKNKLSKLDSASSGLSGSGSKLNSLLDSVSKVQTIVAPSNTTVSNLNTDGIQLVLDIIK